MEWVAAAAAIGAIWYVAHHQAKAGGSSGSSSSGSKTGQPAPPTPPPPPAGVYAPNTPGAVKLRIDVIGGDGYGQVSASPGGTTQTALELWYGPGTKVTIAAQVLGAPWSFGTAFDHFAGPGITTKSNPITIEADADGYVDAVFATFGLVGV